MLVAWDAQVASLADVGAELEGVVALDLRPVIDELDLFLIHNQRAVTAVDSQSVAELEKVIAIVVDEEGRHPSGKGCVQIDAGNSRVLGRRGLQAVGDHVDLVAEKAEAEVGQQVGPHDVIESAGNAVVERGGLAGEGADAAAGIVAGTTGGTVNTRRIDFEVGQAVSTEPVQLFGLIVIDTSVEGVVVEVNGSRS